MQGSPLRWPGGKFYNRKWIASFAKPHKIFLDLTVGGFNVEMGFQPHPDRLEICNDIFYELINFYQVVKVNHTKLFTELVGRNYCEDSFNWAQDWKMADPIAIKNLSLSDDARAVYAAKFFIRNRLSRDGMFLAYTESPRVRRGMPEMESSYLSAITGIPAFAARIKDTMFVSRDALAMLPYYIDNPDVLIFIDPPYVLDKSSKRSTKNLYEYEVTNQFHIDMLKLLKGAKAQILLCGFQNDLYNAELKDWARHDKPVKIAMGGAKNGHKAARLESLWVLN